MFFILGVLTCCLQEVEAVTCTVVPCGGDVGSGNNTDMPVGNMCADILEADPICVSKASSPGGGTGTYSIGQCNTCTSGYISKLTTVTTPFGCTVQAKRCVKDDGSGGVDPSEDCPSECPSTSEWTPMGNNKEGKCVILIPGFGEPSEASCAVRCVEGSYNTGTDSLNCVDCPENATCSGGDSLPVCVKNYYRESVGGNEYKCIACPAYFLGNQTMRGLTLIVGATSKNECYEPVGNGHVKMQVEFPDKTNPIGKYNILEDKACFWK